MPVDAGTVGIRAVPDFEGFGSLFNQGIRSTLIQAEGLGKQLSSALGGGMKAGLVLAGAGAAIAITDFVSKGVQEYGRLAETTRELDHITGASAERTSLFASVLRHLGVDAASAGRPLGLLANNIQNHTDLFAKYGVQIARTSSGQADLLGTLENLRKSFSGSADATQRDAAAKALLGRGFQTLIPYLALSNTQLRQFQDIARRSGEVFTQADLDNARQMAVNVAKAKSEIEAVKLAVGRETTTLVNNFFSGLNVLSKTGAGDLPRVFGNILTGGIVELPDHIKNAVSAENDLSRTAAETKIRLQEEADAANVLGTAIQGVHSAEEGVHSAQEGVQHAAEAVRRAREGIQRASEGVTRAVRNEGAAQQSLNDLLEKGAVDAQAVTQAQQGLEQSHRSVRDATESLTAAQEHLNEVQAGASATELTDAHLSLASATLQLAEARFQLGRAIPTAADPFAQQRARLGVSQAVEQQKKARDALTQTQQKGTSADANLTAAQKQVRDASERLTDAFRAEDDAAKKLREAQAGDPEFNRKVAAAKQAVADTAIAVRDAQIAERDAGQSLRDAQQSYADSEQTLTDAKIRLRDANDKVNEALDAEAAKGVNLNAVLDQLKAKYPELAGIIEQFYSRVTAAQASSLDQSAQNVARYAQQTAPGALGAPPQSIYPSGVPSPTPPAGRINFGAIYGGGRADGGDVFPGYFYRWQEAGQEFFAPKVPGKVIPAGTDGASAPSGDTYHIHIHAGVVGDKEAVLRWLAEGLRTRQRGFEGRR